MKKVNSMVTVKVAAKALGVPKGKVKDMIKAKEVEFEKLNGRFYVNIQEVKNKLELKSQLSYEKSGEIRKDDFDKIDTFKKYVKHFIDEEERKKLS